MAEKKENKEKTIEEKIKEQNIKKVAVFTSGGDAPGMNACIRAVVRTCSYHGVQIKGIMRGYAGIIDGDFKNMTPRSVSNIIQRGGTILKSARSEEFKTKEGMEQAYFNLKAERIEGVIAIGGDGTFRGAYEFSQKYDIPFIGVPGTIDNDMFGTDFTIGYDTALNTVVECIDKIRDTAHAHDRLFFIEVMGRDAGFIALYSGIASGAEAILIPETETNIDNLVESLDYGWRRKKTSSIVLVAEGEEVGGAIEIAKMVKERMNGRYDIRVTILGHIQRGGAPTCNDRVLASRLGVRATEALLAGERNIMAGMINNKIVFTDFVKATKHNTEINRDLLRISEILSY